MNELHQTIFKNHSFLLNFNTVRMIYIRLILRSIFTIKKIDSFIFLFILIFLLGIYSFTFYISNTIDQKIETDEQSEIKGSATYSDWEATQIN